MVSVVFSCFVLIVILNFKCTNSVLLTCDVGWTRYHDNCYKFYPSALSWSDSKISCDSHSSILAVIPDNTTNNFIVKNITSGYRSWVGLRNSTVNKWEWSVVNRTAKFFNWANGEPNNKALFGDEQCVEIEDASGKWNDETCSSKRPYVCQKSLGCDTAIIRNISNPRLSSNASRMSVGTTLSLNAVCGVGYRPTKKTGNTTCLRDGYWSYPDYDCKEIYCDALHSSLPNGRYYIDDTPPYQVGAKIYFTCNSGYMLWGNDEVRCRDVHPKLSFGLWGQPPICIKSPECDAGWTDLNGNCYKFVDMSLTWREAEKQCRLEGNTVKAGLASISNRYENELVQKLGANNGQIWIGLHDNFDEGVWEWTDGSSVKYKNFESGEPNNGAFPFSSSENCVEMDTSTGEWNDEECDYLRSFVCEKPLGS